MAKTKNIPTIFVVFGITGDLATKKIVPALFHLFSKGALPTRFRVIGFARRPLSRGDFERRLETILERHRASGQNRGAFFRLFSYFQGNFENRLDYENLAKTLKQADDEWGMCSNKLFYWAVPPQGYEPIAKHLAATKLSEPCGPDGGWTPLEVSRQRRLPSQADGKGDGLLTGWTRIIVEKPFGKDLKTAEKLDELLGKLFKENQIYRIDHYLAKEMLQNILAFRFSNSLFEDVWDNRSIEEIRLRTFETAGVEDRGSFYDGFGAFRDVGQNHLLQMLALLAMDHPRTLDADAIREKRAEVLGSLKLMSLKEIQRNTFRGQYRGYRDIRGVAPNSQTETYFKIRAELVLPRWEGVPIILEAGKRMPFQQKEIAVTFRDPLPGFHLPGYARGEKNKLIFGLEPDEKIEIQFWSKKPGLAYEVEKRTLDFFLRRDKAKPQYIEEYEKLLLDCIEGDQTLFVTTAEVKAMWRFADPIVEAWEKNAVPLHSYQPNTDTILKDSVRIGEPSSPRKSLKREIGIVGLGKMGGNLARRLVEKGWNVVGWNRTATVTQSLEKEGLQGAYSLKELVEKLTPPRIIWIELPAFVTTSAGKPAGSPVDEALKALFPLLSAGDTVIDGGNSYFKDAIRRQKLLAKRKIEFVDVGVSGGPGGARHGASLMIGGKRESFAKLEPLFYDLARENGYQFFAGHGAGHFVKMVHNGIEYGMMQALAEGFAILKKSKYKLDLTRVADIYNHGSVIESRLVGWLEKAFELHGEDLGGVSGSVKHTGEGAWTVKTAKEMKLKAKIIEGALQFRIQSEKNPSYTGKILSALRGQFGGHPVRSLLPESGRRKKRLTSNGVKRKK